METHRSEDASKLDEVPDARRSWTELLRLRATAERLGFWDDLQHWDAVLRWKRRYGGADEGGEAC